jgi:hypothetical protein
MAVSAVTMAAMMAVLGLSTSLPLTMLALLVFGACWMLTLTLLNIAIQMSVPRWVTGRTLATFQAATAGGVALGSWLWGHVAELHGISAALLASAGVIAVTAMIGRFLPMPQVAEGDREPVQLDVPAFALALTGRSGPIVVEVEYRVAMTEARNFYGVMQQIQRVRQRNGGYDWSIARDITDPELWTERFHCPTWHDYLRLRARYTAEDLELQEQGYAFHSGPDPVRILRRLERPFGSVRWREDAPDRGTEVMPLGTPLGNG